MARYTGPRLRILRRLDVNLPGLSRKTKDARPTPPGEHGGARRRGQPSDYKIRLAEKQKVRFNYGLSEKQLRRYMKMANASRRSTAEALCSLLERRLDNVVFRLGLAPTIPAARQLVNHGHIAVNGRKVDIASFLVKPGMSVGPRGKSKELAIIVASLEAPSLSLPDYLEWDSEKMAGTMNEIPGTEHVPFEFTPLMVIEYYSQRL